MKNKFKAEITPSEHTAFRLELLPKLERANKTFEEQMDEYRAKIAQAMMPTIELFTAV